MMFCCRDRELHLSWNCSVNLRVPKGRILSPVLRQTRTEVDYLENIEAVIGLDPDAGYRLIADNLNTHSS